MSELKRSGIFSTALISALLMLGGCTNNDAPASPASTSFKSAGTQAPGDLWTSTFSSDGTFSAVNTNATNAVSFSATTAAQASGLTKLTVTTTSDVTKVAIGAIGYLYTVPGTATLMWPPGATSNGTSDTRLVALVAQDAAASFTVGAKFNWIDIPTATWSSGYKAQVADATALDCASPTGGFKANDLGNGTVTAVSGSAVTVSIDEFDYCGNATATGTTNNLTDKGNGQIQGSSPGGTTITFQVSPSGAFMGDSTKSTPQSVAGFIGMKAPSSSVDTTAFYSVNRTFRGLLFRTTSNGAGKFTNPIGATVTAAGSTISGFRIDPTTGASVGSGVTINLGAESATAKGVFKNATITAANGTNHQATFVINQINGKYFTFGFGFDGSPFNFILLEQ